MKLYKINGSYIKQMFETPMVDVHIVQCSAVRDNTILVFQLKTVRKPNFGILVGQGEWAIILRGF